MRMRFAYSNILPLHSCMSVSFIMAKSVLVIACATDQQRSIQQQESTFCLLGCPVACFLVDLPCSISRHLSLMRLRAPSFNTESFTHSAYTQIQSPVTLLRPQHQHNDTAGEVLCSICHVHHQIKELNMIRGMHVGTADSCDCRGVWVQA